MEDCLLFISQRIRVGRGVIEMNKMIRVKVPRMELIETI
jgi:hypothetical protein